MKPLLKVACVYDGDDYVRLSQVNILKRERTEDEQGDIIHFKHNNQEFRSYVYYVEKELS